MVLLANRFDGRRKLQITVLDGELQDDVPLALPFGLSGRPPVGSEGLVLSIMGKTSHRVAVGVDHASYRVVDELDGEMTIYNAHGYRIRLGQGGITITTAGGTGTVTINGNLNCTGQVSDANGTMQEMRNVYNPHNHGGAGPNNSMM
jgi:phage baseplate assembly protein V